MTRPFADTFYFLALANPTDQAHDKAVEYTTGFTGTMVTTAWVMTEWADAMSAPRNRRRFVELYRRLVVNKQMQILPADQELFDAGLTLYEKRPDKEWSLTDCISFEVMTRQGIRDALTGDHHFEQAGFVAILK